MRRTCALRWRPGRPISLRSSPMCENCSQISSRHPLSLILSRPACACSTPSQASCSEPPVGYDLFGPTIERATANARAAGVADRVRIEQRDVSKGLPEQYDVITTEYSRNRTAHQATVCLLATRSKPDRAGDVRHAFEACHAFRDRRQVCTGKAGGIAQIREGVRAQCQLWGRGKS
jgi:hypothetical protein